MRILFSARPAYGHVYPLVPLALAARRAGHEVHFATTGPFLERLRRLGFATHDVGVTLEAARDELMAELATTAMPTQTDGRPDLSMGARLFIDGVARATAADLRDALPAVDADLVVYEQYDFGAAVAAFVAGIPAVCHVLSPLPIGTVLHSSGSADRLARLWAEHGVAEAPLDVFAGDALIDIFPAVMQSSDLLAAPNRIPLRPIPFVEAGATVPSWVGRTGRPLVYVTLGTVVATDDALLPAIRGLARLDADVLVALGAAAGAGLGPLPPNVHVEAFVDQPAVLSRADLAVHHGGSGTILACLAFGTPQLLLPKGADQFFNADMMTATGLAPVLEPAAATEDAVGAAAAAELGQLRPIAATARAELLGLPDPDDVVAQLADRFDGRRVDEPAA